MEDGSTAADGTMVFTGEAWFDPIEAGLRERVRGFIEELVERELRRRWGVAAASGRQASRRATGTGRVSARSWAASPRW